MSELVEVKQIGEVEHIVHASGQWDGTGPVEFSNDGQEWTTAWAPSEEHPHPEYSRVSVYRKDVRIPTEVTIRWDEQYPAASEEWSGMWDRSPTRHFGRTARMVGFRQTFRDLLSNIVIEDEGDDRATPTAQHVENAEAAAPAPRDWAAEIAAAESAEMLDAIEKDGRAVRIFTADGPGTELWRSLRARRREIEKKWADVESAWEEPAIADAADVPVVAADEVTDSPAPKPGAPRDYLPPMNRAARRKAARKKGGKR
ncbi:hypothetical protein PTQ19_07020 [Microbacterium esteraromaticum]|uniref:hypothetical protein n=1 Tax=Microbacterium esteraromaticum TaxID=57043 RepID=UPI002367982E|nr:hypothetical protein [Microbacterium esteraromaticum]WDH80174.1 hypothetical protein PTQ19_07020 [Microbacterium esteraromaticum]